ncbi:MAG: DNA primase [Dehalococcoidia bacterium]
MNEVEEIKARLDIVEVVGQYVQLKRTGRSFKANCPFHSEKTPSFIVSAERQSWHCFGACGTGGDVFSFVMRREGVEFPEALRLLATRAGVDLPERGRRPEEERQRERVHSTNETAARWYHELLVKDDIGKSAWGYVQKRGIDEPTAEAFLLGYSPPSWEATREHLRESGYSDAELLAAGLLVEGERGLHDRFRGRLMFPIRDVRGRFTGFGARALDESVPKYLNTAQTQGKFDVHIGAPIIRPRKRVPGRRCRYVERAGLC